MWGGFINRINMLMTDKEKPEQSKLGADAPATPNPKAESTHIPLTPSQDSDRQMSQHMASQGATSERQKQHKISIFGDVRPWTVASQNQSTTINTSAFSERRITANAMPSTAINSQKTVPVLPSQQQQRLKPAVFGLHTILTENQLKTFNFELYKRINEPRPDWTEEPTETVSVNSKAIYEKMQVVAELIAILTLQARPNSGHNLPELSQSALDPFKTRNETKAIAILFEKKSTFFIGDQFLKNKFELENELFQLKQFADHQLLTDSGTKIAQIERYFTFAYTTLDSAQELIAKIRKQRYCLMEIRKNGAEILSIRRKLRRKQNMQNAIELLSKLQERFKKFSMMINQKFAIERACSIYNNLIIALVYCHKKLADGMDLVMLKVFQHRLEARLLYIKHKLNQNFYFELRMFKNCREKFNSKALTEIVRQMVSIEEAAKSLTANSKGQAKEIDEMLRKDQTFLRGNFRGPTDEADVFGDLEIKTMVVGIYKSLLTDEPRNHSLSMPTQSATLRTK